MTKLKVDSKIKLMPKNVTRVLIVLLLPILLVVQFPFSQVSAEITSCGATVTPNQVDPGTSNNFVINVQNTDSEDVVWIEITRPSDNFTLGNIIATGWSITNTGSSFVLTNGSLAGGASRNFFLTGTVVANTNAPSANWRVTVSDDPGGANPFDCTGNLGTQIGQPDTTAPVISNIAVSSISSSGAVVSWTTDELANSLVNYGLTTGYGSNSSNGTFKTSHQQTLTGLSAGTSYHFRVVSADQSNNTGTSADNTFITSNSSSGSSVPKPTSTIQPNSSDQSLPTLILKTNLNQIFPAGPEIEGSATDNVGVSQIEYSLDNGANFIKIDSTGLNSKDASFKFTPTIVQEGNYLLVFRVTDLSNNILISDTYTLIIDRDAPTFGPSLVTVGPQVLTAKDNTIRTTTTQEHKIYLPIKGGAISANIQASTKDKSSEKLFNLTFSADSGLWIGAVSFEKAGDYELLVQAVDGAGKKGSKALASFRVIKPLEIVDSKTNKPVSGVKAEVFNYTGELGQWQSWPAEVYQSQNPQTSNQNGEASFLLPSGEYFLKLSKDGYQLSVSDKFTIDSPTVLTGTVELKPAIKIGLGEFAFNLPTIIYQNFKIDPSDQAKSEKLETAFPEAELSATDDTKVKSSEFLGKPTVVCFLSTWSPTTAEQVHSLVDLQRNSNFNIVPIFPLESKEKVVSYLQVGNYSLKAYLDETGEMLTKFKTTTLPNCQFFDQTGKLISSQSAVLTKEELEYNLNN